MATMRRPTKRITTGQSPSYAPTSTLSNEKNTISSPHHHRSSSTSSTSPHRNSRRRGVLFYLHHTHSHQRYRPIFLVLCLTIGAFGIFQTLSSIITLESNYFHYLRRTTNRRHHDKNLLHLDNDPSTIILETLINRSDIVVNRLLNITHSQIMSSSSSSSSVPPKQQSKRFDHGRRDLFWRQLKHQFNFSTSWNESSTTIPHNLWFTDKENLLLTKKPSHYYENVVNTIQRYTNAFRHIDDDSISPKPTTNVEFATDEDCVVVLDVTMGLIEQLENLTMYFREEMDGSYKSDICRLGLLYIYGGYYFDVDMKVVTPIVAETIKERIPPRPVRYDNNQYGWNHMRDIRYHPDFEEFNATQQQQQRAATPLNTTLTFMTAIDTPKEYFFQSFLACTPRHPIIESALRYIVLHYQGKTAWETEDKLLGPITLIMAYQNITKVHPAAINNDDNPDYYSVGMFWEDLDLKVGTTLATTHAIGDYFDTQQHDVEMTPHHPAPANVTPFQESVYQSSFIFHERELGPEFLPHYPRQNASSSDTNCHHVVYQEMMANTTTTTTSTMGVVSTTTTIEPRVFFYSRIVGSRGCPFSQPPLSIFNDPLSYIYSLMYTNPTGTCGDGHVGNGYCPDRRDCCSEFGYCGRSDEFCDDDDNAYYWQSGLREWVKVYGGYRGTCGDGIVGDGRCPDERDCCSSFGYCGRDDSFCYNRAEVVGGYSHSDSWTWFMGGIHLFFLRLILMISRDSCGDGVIGNGVCVNETDCCSIMGYCGTTEEFCDYSIGKYLSL